MRRRRNHPEWRGDGTAKALEVERVKRVRQQQLEQAQKRMKELEEKAMSESATQQKRPVRHGEPLGPELRKWLTNHMVGADVDNPQTLTVYVTELNEAIRKCQIDPSDVGAREQIRVFLRKPMHSFSPPWRLYFGVWAGFINPVVRVPVIESVEDAVSEEPDSGVFESSEQATVEHQPRPPSSEETGIVRRVEVDGIVVPWILPTLTREGAERARVSLTDAAVLLGYPDKDTLRQLAGRHSQEIAEFGETFTVKVSVRQGFTNRIFDEPAYNFDQFVLLGLSSKTETGMRIRVWLLKSFNKLLAGFEQISKREQPSLIERTLVMLAANQNTTNMLLSSLLGKRRSARRAPPSEQQTIPNTEPPAYKEAEKPAAPAEPSATQKLRASGRLNLLPVPGKVHARDVCDAIHRMVKTVSEVSGWPYDDLFNGVYDRIQIEMKWNPRERPASEKSALKYIGSQSQERKLECYRIAYEVLVAPYIG